MAMQHIGVFTSGGDSPGMNACIRAIVRTALHQGLQVSGIYRGYQGMIDGDIRPLDYESVSNIIHRGGTILKSARCEAFRTKDGRKKAFEQLQAHGIDALIAIGGDGTFTGAQIFGQEFDIPIIGLPGTIDNDIAGTDHTIGFDTALNTAIEAIDRVRDTASSHDRLFFVEVMGRDSGYIALHSGIAGGAEVIMLPEAVTDFEKLLTHLDEGDARGKTSSIVVVAEGDEHGGALSIAEQIRKKRPKYDTRATILGHLQRGGSPSCSDRVLGIQLGSEAVKQITSGVRGCMLGKVNDQVVSTPFSQALKAEKKLDPILFNHPDVLIL